MMVLIPQSGTLREQSGDLPFPSFLSFFFYLFFLIIPAPFLSGEVILVEARQVVLRTDLSVLSRLNGSAPNVFSPWVYP